VLARNQLAGTDRQELLGGSWLPRSQKRLWLLSVGLWLAVALMPRPAQAYTWMIRHGYTGCATCHVDPSGAGLLNEFGRGEAADTLRSHYGSDPPAVEPFFGLWKNPDWLLTGGSFRDMILFTKTDGAPLTQQNILMQADLRLGVETGRWRGAASLGLLANGNSPAALVGSLVAREFWLGYTFANDAVLLRAGRINVPFGLRLIEHTLFVRQATRTDINDTQEYGLALAARGGSFRGEVMGIAGNYQESPDAFRERGASGYLEWMPASHYAFGVSSLVTHAAEDVYLRTANTRQAHGVTLRVAPVEPLVFLGEGDLVIQAPAGQSTWTGLATMLQADFEPWQGLHFMATGETYRSGQPGTATSWSLWAGLAWFFYSHLDARIDYVHQNLSTPGVRIPVDAYMIQLHLFL
jgi:hypothetical protein